MSANSTRTGYKHFYVAKILQTFKWQITCHSSEFLRMICTHIKSVVSSLMNSSVLAWIVPATHDLFPPVPILSLTLDEIADPFDSNERVENDKTIIDGVWHILGKFVLELSCARARVHTYALGSSVMRNSCVWKQTCLHEWNSSSTHPQIAPALELFPVSK